MVANKEDIVGNDIWIVKYSDPAINALWGGVFSDYEKAMKSVNMTYEYYKDNCPSFSVEHGQEHDDITRCHLYLIFPAHRDVCVIISKETIQ